MTFEAPVAFLLQIAPWKMILDAGPTGWAVIGFLFCFSVFSWTVIFSKWNSFRGSRQMNSRFLRAFRKAGAMDAVMVASEQFRPSPLVAVFDFGYEELERRVKARGIVTNRTALERTLQLGVSGNCQAGTKYALAGHHRFGHAVHRPVGTVLASSAFQDLGTWAAPV